MTQTAFETRPYGGTGLTLAQLDELPEDERNAILVGTISMLREQLGEIKLQLAEAESLVREYMAQQRATLMVAGDFEVKRVEKTKWEYDTEGLAQIPDVVNLSDRERELFKKAVKPTIAVNKTELNRLAKYGGRVAAIIDQCTWQKLIGFDLELRRLAK